MVTCYVKMYTKLKRTTTRLLRVENASQIKPREEDKEDKDKNERNTRGERRSARVGPPRVFLDSFGNLREEIEQETRDDATTEILYRIQSNAVCVVELLQKMDAILTSENTTVRARATEKFWRNAFGL